MNIKKLAIWGLVVNAILTFLKIVVGIFSGSVAILAEGIHSGADVFSSGVAIWGIKKSEKPADEKHPYGYARYESLASLVVVVLLIVGAGWIIYEAVGSLIHKSEMAQFSILGIVIMIISIVLNEVMARLKFRYGSQEGSQVLVADGQHDRADVIASIAVLIGLILIKWIPIADVILAILVGLYILYECIDLTKESVESLVDTANPKLQEKIKKYLKEKGFDFDDVKTRKIGSSNFAEISLLCDAKAKVEEVDNILNKLKTDLINDIDDLTSVTVSVKSHSVKSGIVKPVAWGRFGYRRKIKKMENIKVPEKRGDYRIAISLNSDKKEIAKNELGTRFYYLLDLENNKVQNKEIVENPFYSKEAGKGVRFLSEFKVDKFLAKHVGKGAKENLKNKGIEFEVLKEGESLDEVLKRF